MKTILYPLLALGIVMTVCVGLFYLAIMVAGG